MEIEAAKVLAILVGIVTSLVTTILTLFRWVKKLIRERNERDALQIASLEEQLGAAQGALIHERELRIQAEKDYSENLIQITHRSKEMVHAVLRAMKTKLKNSSTR